MITLEFRFERGKYHATKWGRNVDEGFVDWPPSPWRIMRAIIYSWKMYHSDIAEDVVWPILQAMISSKILFKLPPARQAHTRHYVPLSFTKNKRLAKAKMLDSFVVVGKESPMYAIWEDTVLDVAQQKTLQDILSSIRYIGRSESICTVRMTDKKIEPNCAPLNGRIAEDMEITDVLAPSEEATLDRLCVNIRNLHKKHRMVYPPGSMLVQYTRMASSLSAMPSPPVRDNPIHVTAMRFAITGKVRPWVTDAVKIGDSFKRAAMSAYGTQNPGSMSWALSGMDIKGDIMRDNHSHAFFLPTDEDGDRKLDHVTVVAKHPFEQDVIVALASIRRIRHSGELLRITYLARGKKENFKAPILQRSKRWVSDTPYALNRHMKTRRMGERKCVVDGPEEQLRRETQSRGMPSIKEIEVKTGVKVHGFLPVQYNRWRKGGLPGFGAYAVRIEFEESVDGPISLGHASHFGLGMFVPENGVVRR